MVDLTVLAIPGYFASMAAEYRWQKAHADERGPTPGDYERNDTLASLAMGVGSILTPLALAGFFRAAEIRRDRFTLGRALAGGALAAAAATTAADAFLRRHDTARRDDADPTPTTDRDDRTEDRGVAIAEAVSSIGGVTAIAAGGAAATASWTMKTSANRLFKRRILPDLGGGPLPFLAAVAGWDFIYYWNHRIQHEQRYLWAIHVVHHSSERYNLSTALRQPVAGGFGLFVPYGLMALLGIRPSHIQAAHGLNLIYQFWIHTEAIDRLGPAEEVLNTASHHRVHHGSNPQYLDRNHGSILIVWDRLFGTFEPEDEPVVYGLTTNIDSFAPPVIATHEYRDMFADVARSRSWRERLSYVFRGPGWAYRRRAERAARAAFPTVDEPTPTPATAA